MLTWINAGCDVGLGLPKCQAMHPTSVLGQNAKYSLRADGSALHPKADVRCLTPPSAAPAGRPTAWAVPSCRAGQPYAPSVNVLVRVAAEIAG